MSITLNTHTLTGVRPLGQATGEIVNKQQATGVRPLRQATGEILNSVVVLAVATFVPAGEDRRFDT